jgi:hypothetical protein
VIDTIRVHERERDQQFDKALETLRVFSLDLCVRRRTDPYIYDRLRCRELLNGNEQ